MQELRETAIQESCCGQNAVVERRAILTPKSEETVYAIVTNIVRHSKTSETDSLSNGSVKRRLENGSQTMKKRSKGHKRKSMSS